MCDIGRFEYHWIESDSRLRRPLVAQKPVPWHDALTALRDRLVVAGRANPEGVRFLLSAHASHEELFLFRRLSEELIGEHGPAAITVSWRYREKPQPEASKFKVPAVDAPNVNGARIFGLAPGAVGSDVHDANVTALRQAVEAGRVTALYVLDPGPEGSVGDTSWIVDARTRGTLALLIVQGVLESNLTRVADFVLPGASYVEKEASYTNEQGRLQGTTRVMAAPGDAVEDWQILVTVGAALGVTFDYASAAAVRAAIAERFPGVKALDGIQTITFGRPIEARHWLDASNPSERWKWDFMYQDLPPVKGSVDPSSLPMPPGAIPLKQV
jgi:NADH-quinone oxidoreductase subunit G